MITISQNPSFMGEKPTEAAVQLVHALTHSYTIMLAVGMDSVLISCLRICLEDAMDIFSTYGLLLQIRTLTLCTIKN
jgi:hypothetical protein